VVPACDICLHKYREIDDDKPVDTERFVQYVENVLVQYVENVLVPVLGNFWKKEPRSVVIMFHSFGSES
jgi:hypothetical protein